MQKFIFDPSKGETPASVARKREIADALLARRSAPRNVGEGLSELGNALAYRAVMGKVRKGEKYGQEQQSSARSALLAELGGGGGSQAPAGPPAFPATAQPVQRAPIDYPSQRVAQAHGDPTVEQMTAYIREAAPGYGVDPDTAVRVARSEGLQPGVWQSNVMKNGQREESYGPFQLFMGGGLGNEFQQQTGLNPADKSTWKQQIDFALSKAKEGGWSPWYGAAKVGVDRWTGLRDQPAPSLKDGVRAAYASLNPNGGAIPAAQPQASQGGLGLPQLIEIAGNKWAMQDPVVSSVVGSLIQNELGARKPMSAMEKAQLEGVLLDNQAKRNAVPDAPTVQKLKLSDGSEVAVQWDGQQWVPIDAPEGGGLAAPKNKLTESQSKLTLFQSLQTETQPVLLDLEKQFNPGNLPDAFARGVLGGNFLQTREGQIYNSAATAWAEGALRIATGAAATPEEMERTKKAYFAQPGDGPETIRFKAQMREMYDRSIQRALGSTDVEGNLPLPSEFAASVGSPEAEGTGIPEGITPEEWDTATPEEKALWLK